MKTVKEFMESTYDSNREFQVRPFAVCADGFGVSIQGGTNCHYCTPRARVNIYHELELGFPTELDKLIEPYAERKNTTDTVFAYVPIDVVEKLIAKHGGIKEADK